MRNNPTALQVYMIYDESLLNKSWLEAVELIF